jgi:hypothetical protein
MSAERTLALTECLREAFQDFKNTKHAETSEIPLSSPFDKGGKRGIF